eukprot:Skav213727  [mRNA]  locus=scaffold2563:115961:120707:+ [translate_table: standard]
MPCLWVLGFGILLRQLSHVTQRSTAAQCRALASEQGRDVRVHLGEPVATRSNSQWAGSWSGVGTISDFPSRELHLAYQGERSCGRVLTTQHFVQSFALTVATVYGYPRGPTWPNARQLTESLVEVLSQEIVLGASGPRIIGGDFNCGDSDLEAFRYWQRMGWRSAQDFALEMWGVEKKMTCKGSTEPDLVWLSPEALSLLQQVTVHDLFMEHAAVQVDLTLPLDSPMVLAWPLPSVIPWSAVDSGWLEQVSAPAWDQSLDVDAAWAEWGSSLENCLQGHVSSQPNESLLAVQKGRCQRTAPLRRPSVAHTVRPSRPSEVSLRNDLAGSAVKSWFRQLRRLQSYKHAIEANKQTPSAICYRLELWTSILRSNGFHRSFPYWWQHLRSINVEGCPVVLPTGPPGVQVARAIFGCFRQCFERFERWHLGQRTKLLKAKYDKSLAALYQDLKPPERERLDFLQETREYQVVGVDPGTCQVHVDSAVQAGNFVWSWDGDPIKVEVVNEYTLQLSISDDFPEQGHLLTQCHVTWDTAGLHARSSTGAFTQKAKGLTARWNRLKCSRAPLSQKFVVLSTAFWPSVLHGSHGSTQSLALLRDLRTAALSSLGVNKAGTNSLLRLSLSGWPTVDPGFWRLKMLVHSFRRLAWKEPILVNGWTLFMLRFEGALYSGPFSQMLAVLNQIGWTVRPPLVTDHDGVEHHLLHLDSRTLDELLLDGWLQHVSHEVVHRKQMSDLAGLDYYLAPPDAQKMSGLELARLGALQSGVFLTPAAQSKFDASKTGQCLHCDTRDDQLHWLSCPLRAHLRPNPWALQWKKMKLQISDDTKEFQSVPCGQVQHLFTDGSATTGPYAMAAWGCVNASSGLVVGVGHLPGLTQNSSRSELSAVISALEWQLRFKVTLHLWCDCKYIVDSLHWVLRHGVAGPWSNGDLWKRVEECIAQLDGDTLFVHWVPSHLDLARLEDPFEEWIHQWNTAVDQLAGYHNHCRTEAFWTVRNGALAYRNRTAAQMSSLQAFYGKIASEQTQSEGATFSSDFGQPVPFVVQPGQTTFVDHFPDQEFDVQFFASSLDAQFSLEFLALLFRWISNHDSQDHQVYPLTFVELTLLLVERPGFRFPFTNPRNGYLECCELSSRRERPTLACLLRVVRMGIKKLACLGDFDDILFSGLSRTCLGIHYPVDGLFCRLRQPLAAAAAQRVHLFAGARPLRKASDLARPV